VDVLRRAQYALPAALVERAELVTRVAKNGRSQSVVRYDFKTKATLLEIRLPEGPRSGPSSSMAGRRSRSGRRPPGRGMRRRFADKLLLTLPAQTEAATRRLQIVFENEDVLDFRAKFMPPPPECFVRAESSKDAVEVPQANLVWTLVLPPGTKSAAPRGRVYSGSPAAGSRRRETARVVVGDCELRILCRRRKS